MYKQKLEYQIYKYIKNIKI